MEVDVVQPDVPLLLGLDILDREQLVPDNIENLLESRLYGWGMPVTRRFGHMYISCDVNKIMFTRTELYKLHRHLHHPSTGKLMALLKRSKLYDVDNNTRKILEEISNSCPTCQTFSNQPQRFKVLLPNNKVIFKRVGALDLMWLDGHATLHVVDIDTHLSSTSLQEMLDGQTVEHVWESFLECWTTLCTGFPDKIKVDQ